MLLSFILSVAQALTPGWDNVNPDRMWPQSTNVVWRAPFAEGAAAFDVSLREGAEGTVEFRPDGIRIVKTNARGAIVVAPKRPFGHVNRSSPRTFANVREVDGDPMRSLGFLRLWSGAENLTIAGNGAYGPSPLNHFLIGTEPQGKVRKLALPPAESAAGPDFTPAIVVAGAPSTSLWTDWGAEDVGDADRVWKAYKAERWKTGVRNHSAEVSPENEVMRAIFADTDHTAKVVKRDGFARLQIDGRDAPPVFYKGYGGPYAYCGRRMEEKADLRLQIAGITFGGRVTNDPGIRPHWTREGFDLTGAVERVRHYLCAAPNSLFLLGISVNPYPEFADDNPSERWIGPDGQPVRGRGCIVAWDQKAAAKDPKAWTLTSQFSPLWREQAKVHISALVAELKRTGLAKRIVGVHLSGSHDGQFGMPLYDYSPHAKAAYRRFLAARGKPPADPPDFARYGTAESGVDFFRDPKDRDLVDFQEFIHHASVGIQEDLARHAKACFGKDVIAVKYCLSVFAGLKAGEFDFTRFLNSDAIDVFAAQSCYKRRPAAIPIPEKRVTASLHEHGKLFVSELDFEAYHRGPTFCRDEFAAMSWGYLLDYPMWEAANRKAVGQMLAQRQGFWYYDMGGDYFDDDRMLADIRGVMGETRRIAGAVSSAWRPSAAVVVDEKGMMFRNFSRSSHGTIVDARDSVAEQLALLEMSAAPFDTWLMDDFLRKPELAERYRTVFVMGAYELDAVRRDLIGRLCRGGRTVVLGSGAGVVGGAAEVGLPLDVVPRQKAPGHEIVPAPGYADEDVKGFFETEVLRVALGAAPGTPKHAVRRPHRISIAAADGVEAIGRYVADGATAVAAKRVGEGRIVAVCDQMGLTPSLFNRLVRESGGYVCGLPGRVQVNMNGDFISVHCLRSGRYDFELPFAAKVTNLKNGQVERTDGRILPLKLTAGRTCWFALAPVAAVATSAEAQFISPAEKREGHTVASFYKTLANAKEIRSAMLSATALGVFEVEVNGKKVGNDFLKPGFTECGKCRHVFTYDVTHLMKTAKGAQNEFLAQVAPTWWCDRINRAKTPTPWQLGKEVAFRGELAVEYADGSHESFGTGTDWLAAYSGWTQTAGLYEGEVVDRRESIDHLKPAKVNDEFHGELRPATAKIRLREDLTLVPKDIYVTCGAEGTTSNAYGRAKVVRRYRDGDEISLDKGEMLVLDFGQNCSAVPMLQLSGRAGTTLELRHAEMLNEANGEKSRGNDGPAGTPYLASLRSAYAGVKYTLAGGGDTYRPSFTFFGYRYIGVTTTAPVRFQRIRSIPVSSVTKEMERGTIMTGNARVNRLIENVRWGMRSNFISIPTDCPQRDERLGWTADTQVFMNTAAYFADTWDFLRKYLGDLRDGQTTNGLYRCFAPNVRHVFPPWASCGWTDAGVIIPYRLWKWYGKREVIDENWEAMDRYMGFLRSHKTPYQINHADWLAYEHKNPKKGGLMQDPQYVKVLNAYFPIWMARLMKEMAAATGRTADAARYAQEESRYHRAFAETYVGEDGCMKDYWKGQCSDLYMLKLGLCGNSAAVEATKRHLIEDIRAHGNQLQTGFLGTAILMPTLTFEAGAPDVAYDLLLQDKDPSWLYSVDQGATTVWERWNSYTKAKGFGPTSMNSFNHYAYGCVVEWLFAAAAGIRPDPAHPGWKHFILHPYPDRRLGSVEATYDSPAGRIRSAWSYAADGTLRWEFSIPAGASATVTAPDGTVREYGPGEYRSGSLEEGFLNPPMSARPQTWWHWMNGNVSKEGITADLEAMAEIGIGGATIFDAGCGIPPGPLKFASPEWFDTVKHAAAEARRLGIELCLPNCSGWSSSGGPWNPPENGMKMLAWTERRAKGPGRFAEKLDPIPNRHGFAADIAVFAVPVPSAELATMEAAGVKVASPSPNVRVLSFPEPYAADGFIFRLDYGWIWHVPGDVTVETSDDGASFERIGVFGADLARRGGIDCQKRCKVFARPLKARHYRFTFRFDDGTQLGKTVKLAELTVGRRRVVEDLSDRTFAKRGDRLTPLRPVAPDQLVRLEDVRVLTDRMRPDGFLDWEMPAGDWRIVRLGYAATGRVNKPASRFGEGLEVDKLSASALDFHFEQYVAKLVNHLGPLAGDVASGLSSILVDSYEVGSQNWTQGFENEFLRRRGYDLTAYLPTLTGTLVGDAEQTDRFLSDFRRTVAELFAENYSGALARKCHQYGLKLSLEPYGNAPCDDFEYGDVVDQPMCEFWSWCNRGDRETDVGNASLPSYLAHFWGRRYVGAEAFTANPAAGAGRWRTVPFALKAQGDRAFARGVNRIIFHRFAHQPFVKPAYLPGVTMGHWGMHLDRTQTWWKEGRPWMDYLARTQWMLQEGTFCADVLCWHGEEAPSRGGHIDGYPKELGGHPCPDGFAKDVCSTRALRSLKVEDGRLVSPGGIRYSVLVLQDVAEMSPETLETVAKLVDAGACVAAPRRPVRSLGLRDYPSADAQVAARAAEVWAKGVVKGRAAEALAARGLKPDFVCLSAPDGLKDKTAWLHRRYDDGAETYFVSCPNEKSGAFTCSFRIDGFEPELWDAESGKVGIVPKAWKRVGGRTEVTFVLPPSGSTFVVFRRRTERMAGARAAIAEEVGAETPLDRPWKVTFPVSWYSDGTETKTVEMKTLTDWTSLEDPDLKYFSGTAEYAYGKVAAGELDLGTVKDFATVFVDGRKVATLWRPPYRCAIPAGELTVKVTNLWPNRMIGDDRLYAEDCEWDGNTAVRGYKCCPVKRLPDWVREGRPSPTGRHTFSTWKHWSKEDDLLPSGLLGPVRLTTVGQVAGRAKALIVDFGFKPGHGPYGCASDPAVFEHELAPLATTTRVRAEDLPSALDRATGEDLLVVPCGSAFPVAAWSALTNFLARGGSLLTTGGYAFDAPLVWRDGTWQVEPSVHINKRHGQFRDCLKTEPTQIGAFDPSFLLTNVASVALSSVQDGILPPVRLDGGLIGFAAVGVLGENGHGYAPNAAVWRPVLEAHDSNGREKGPVGAFLRHYRGAYRGSRWAFFGATDRDLFADGSDGARKLLPAVAKRLLDGLFLAETTAGYACYRTGETAVVKTQVANFGPRDRKVSVRLALRDERGNLVHETSVPVMARRGTTSDVQANWTVPEGFADDLVSFAAELTSDGVLVDREDDAFVVWQAKTVANGPKLAADGTIFSIDGRRRFAFGCQTHWAQYQPYTARSPKEMASDFRMMRACGFRWARLFLRWDSEFCRRISDAAVLLAQKYGLVVYHTQQWMDARATGEELAKQNAVFSGIVARYRNVPGFALDICNEPRLDGVSPSPEAVAQEKAWADSNFSAARKSRPDVLVAVGHSQGWGGGRSTKDPAIGILGASFADRHYYGPWNRMFEDLKDVDQRAIGKPLVLAECGAKCHPTFAAANADGVGDTEERYDVRFKCYAAHAFGLGCSAMLAWMWRDPMEGIFPCGIVHQTRVPRQAAETLTRMAQAFGRFELVENPPDVVVCLDEGPRMKSEGRRAYLDRTDAVDRALLHWGANWSKITERAMGRTKGVRLVLSVDELPTGDEGALRTEVGRRLKASGATLARRAGDDETAVYFRVPGADGTVAWLVWNPNAGRSVSLVRGERRMEVPAHGVGYMVTDRGGKAVSAEVF